MAAPSEYYVGIVDFFAILLPGAIAVAIIGPRVMGLSTDIPLWLPQDKSADWAAFLVASYFAGHLIFLLGSYLDGPYDALRKARRAKGNEAAYGHASALRKRYLGAVEDQAVNTFQWSRSLLIAHCPDAAADVHRLEADSKFFRSLLVVSLLTAVTLASLHNVSAAVGACIVAVPCFIRYYERRLKSTTQAYIHIITLHAAGRLGKSAQDDTPAAPRIPAQ